MATDTAPAATLREAIRAELAAWNARARDMSDPDEAATAAVVWSVLSALSETPDGPEIDPEEKDRKPRGKKGGKGGGFPQTPAGVAKVLWFAAVKRRFVDASGKRAPLTEKQAAWLRRTCERAGVDALNIAADWNDAPCTFGIGAENVIEYRPR